MAEGALLTLKLEYSLFGLVKTHTLILTEFMTENDFVFRKFNMQ